MTIENDSLKGWSTSILFHALLCLIFLAWIVNTPVTSIPNEIEVSFIEPVHQPPEKKIVPATAPVAARKSTAPTRQAPSQTKSASISHTKPAGSPGATPSPIASTKNIQTTNVIPPQPRTGLSSEQIRASDVNQSKTVLRERPLHPSTSNNLIGIKESFGSKSGVETGSSSAETGRTDGSSTRSPSTSARSSGTSIEWTNGISRQRIAGTLPSYPEGVNKEVLIAVRFIVSPDGSIHNLTLLRKGEPRFEERVLAAMQGWRFNTLMGNVEQIDQTGTATFYFKLK